MPDSQPFADLDAFRRCYVKPLLVDPLQCRLAGLPVAPGLPPGAVAEPGGCGAERSGLLPGEPGSPRFVHTARGWLWRDFTMLAWRTEGAVAHRRLSERETRYEVIVSEQPDMAGVPRPTVDLHAVRARYERDAASQQAAGGGTCDLGAGWARLTLRWSLRLQLVVTAAGRANVVTRVNRGAPAVDAGRTAPYITADPLACLLDVRRLARDWEQGSASLRAIQDQLVSRLAAAIEPPLARPAGAAAPQFA
jgi:hypothetical protein